MKIAVIGIVGVPASYGGFETLVENIIDDRNHNFAVYCSSKDQKCKLKKYKGAKLHYILLRANGFQSILYDSFSMVDAYFRGYRNFLVLGVSGAFIFPLLKLNKNVFIATNPDGLDRERKKFNFITKRAIHLFEKIAIRFSDIIIADNVAIKDYIDKEYGKNSLVIAYGGDHALISNDINYDEGYALGICRIEPENNIHLILDAFSKNIANLKFIGNWDNSIYGKDLKKKYSKFNNIEIIDPVYDLAKLFQYRRACSYYIHGHSVGGTNPSLVEIMHFAKPILAFDCIYNRETLKNNGKYFKTIEDLSSLIKKNDFYGDGHNIKKVANELYVWKSIKQQYSNVFKKQT